MLTKLSSQYSKVGLKMNTQKTKIMIGDNTTNIYIEGRLIKSNRVRIPRSYYQTRKTKPQHGDTL